MLATATKEVSPPGMDGTSYYFSMRDMTVIGKAWSPSASSRPGQLVALAEAMRGYCNEPTFVSRDLLRQTIAALG